MPSLHVALIAIQIVAIGFGLVGAYLWWNSARSGFEVVSSLAESRSEDGDLAYRVDDKFIIHRVSRSARLNAWAAVCTGASTLLQAVAVGIQFSI
jgi:hypothetical protein